MLDIKKIYFKKNNFEISIEVDDICKVTYNNKTKMVKIELIIEFIVNIIVALSFNKNSETIFIRF